MLGPRQSQRDVGVTARKVDLAVGALEVEDDVGVAVAELVEVRRDEARAQHLGRGDADGALELGVLARKVARNREGLPLDLLGVDHQAAAGGGQDEPARCAVEQTCAKHALKLG